VVEWLVCPMRQVARGSEGPGPPSNTATHPPLTCPQTLVVVEHDRDWGTVRRERGLDLISPGAELGRLRAPLRPSRAPILRARIASALARRPSSLSWQDRCCIRSDGESVEDALELLPSHTAGSGGEVQAPLGPSEAACLPNQQMPECAQGLEFVMWRSRRRRAAGRLGRTNLQLTTEVAGQRDASPFALVSATATATASS